MLAGGLLLLICEEKKISANTWGSLRIILYRRMDADQDRRMDADQE